MIMIMYSDDKSTTITLVSLFSARNTPLGQRAELWHGTCSILEFVTALNVERPLDVTSVLEFMTEFRLMGLVIVTDIMNSRH